MIALMVIVRVLIPLGFRLGRAEMLLILALLISLGVCAIGFVGLVYLIVHLVTNRLAPRHFDVTIARPGETAGRTKGR